MTQYVSDFADLAVTLPVLLAVCLTLAAQGAMQQAAIFLAATLVALAAITAVKLVSFTVLPAHNPLHLYSPSGHTAGAVMVYGGLLQLIGPPRLRVAGGLAVALLIAFTRVHLRAHTISDVLVGAVVGGCGLLLLARLARMRPVLPHRAPRPVPVMLAALLAMFVMHGHYLGGEQTLRDLADDSAALLLPRGAAPIASAIAFTITAPVLPRDFHHA